VSTLLKQVIFSNPEKPISFIKANMFEGKELKIYICINKCKFKELSLSEILGYSDVYELYIGTSTEDYVFCIEMLDRTFNIQGVTCTVKLIKGDPSIDTWDRYIVEKMS